MTSTPAWLTQRSESGECWWCRLETAVRSEPFAQTGELVGRPVSGLKPRALTRLGPRQRPGHLGVRAGSRLRDRDQGCRLQGDSGSAVRTRTYRVDRATISAAVALMREEGAPGHAVLVVGGLRSVATRPPTVIEPRPGLEGFIGRSGSHRLASRSAHSGSGITVYPSATRSDEPVAPNPVGPGRFVAVDQVEGVGVNLRSLMGQGHEGRIEPADQGVDEPVAPNPVGPGRFVAVDQVEGVGVNLRSLMGQGHEGRIEPADQGVDETVARRGLPEPLSDGDGLAMDGCRKAVWPLQGQALDGLPQGGGEMRRILIATPPCEPAWPAPGAGTGRPSVGRCARRGSGREPPKPGESLLPKKGRKI